MLGVMVAVGFVVVMMMLLYGHANEQGGEHRKNVGLDERDQELQEVDEQRKSNTHRSDGIANTGTEDLRKREDEADEALQDNQVAGRQVGKQSDGQCDGLGKNAQDLDRHEDRLDEGRDPGGHRICIQ